jgi:hypothetical protein
MTSTADPIALASEWQALRQRLIGKGLLRGSAPTVSLRIPGEAAMWFGRAEDARPQRAVLAAAGSESASARLHATVYAERRDICAVAFGGGEFGLHLASFGGAMPALFDEQVRHLGRMAGPVRHDGALPAALQAGGNALILHAQPLLLGMTPSRLALNGELFEKCAKAYVLAAAAGGPVQALPWIVRWVANGRLRKDQRRARDATAHGQLPEEARGY